MGLLYETAEAIVRYMESAPPMPVFVVYIFVGSGLMVLVHELGHAVVARFLLGADVEISVGNAGKVAELRLGQITTTINALSLPGREAGSAGFHDSQATARDVVLIALAGPVASLATLVPAVLLLSWGPTAGMFHDLAWAAFPAGVFGVLNVLPYEFNEDHSGPALRTDGRLAVDALRAFRALH